MPLFCLSSQSSLCSSTLVATLLASFVASSVLAAEAAEPSKAPVVSAPVAAQVQNPAVPVAPSAAAATTPTTTPTTTPPNPRVAVIERISKAAMQAMAASEDAVAVVLSSKYIRDANLKPGEKRDDAQKADLQAAALARAVQLAAKTTDKKMRGLVDFQVAMFCIGFPGKPVCAGGDPVQTFAESDRTNVTGWIMMAGRDFGQGLNAVTQGHLETAAKANHSSWFYKEGAAVALQFARAVNEPDAKLGDAEAAAFELVGGMSLPPYKQFSQMCSPDAKGVLPKGRYALCYKIAQLLATKGETNVEIFVGYKAQERLAIGEKKTAKATAYAKQYGDAQEAIATLWKTKLKFPPQTDAEGQGLLEYFANFVKYGEAKATEMAHKRRVVGDKAHVK